MSKSTILIVEDDPVARFVAQKQVSKLSDCNVHAVSTGEAAVEVFPDALVLIFMDIGLPGIDGYTAVCRIREKARQEGCEHVPIVALTGHGDRKRCLNMGMDDYLQKPAMLDDIQQMLEKYLP